MQFRFQLVDVSENPHITIPYLRDDYTPGPYFIQWSLNWPARTFAHEIGHVMGLNDEYPSTGIGPIACDEESVMCYNFGSSHLQQIKNHHIYVILRRGYCD